MSPVEAAAIMFGTFGVLIFLRIPVSFALGLACVPIAVINDRLTPGMLIDDTGLTGKYDIRLEWDIMGGSAEFTKALSELGFVLVDGERPVGHLLVMPDK